MATNTTVVLRLAEAFARHGVTVTFGQSLPSAFHLTAPHVWIRQAAYRQENAGGRDGGWIRSYFRTGRACDGSERSCCDAAGGTTGEALQASIPIVALVQEVTRATTDKNAFQATRKHAEDVTFGEHTDAVDFGAVDHSAIARACGVEGRRVERRKDVGAALDAAFALDGPMLIDVITDPDAKPPISFYAAHYPEPF